jgi:hypothetical protein
MAVYDLQQLKFLYRYFDAGQPDVLVPTGELVIKPNLHTLTDTATVQPASQQAVPWGRYLQRGGSCR